MAWLDWWYAPGEAAKSAELDSQLDRLNREALRNGKITQAEYERRSGRIADGTIDPDVVTKEFEDEVVERARDLPRTVKEGLEWPVNSIIAAVPWWLWVAGILYALTWLGGAKALKGRLAKL